MKLTLTAAGDAVMVQRMNPGYAGFSAIKDFVNTAEAKLVNLELVLTDKNCFASSFCGGTWVTTPKSVLPDLLSYGFNYCSLSNNHIMDFSYGGLRSTIDTLNEAGVAYSGAGENLFEASKPAILNLPSARVAVISIGSSFDDSARAGNANQSFRGRPGLNPLRFETIYTITEEQMKTMQSIAAETYINGEHSLLAKDGFVSGGEGGIFTFGGHKFKVGKVCGKETHPHPADLERTLKSIDDARRVADYVVLMVHSHQIRTDNFLEPDYFFEEFSRACIDRGAHAVIGGGTHQIKPIEIYKGRPIFYSLGNFIFQSNVFYEQPADFNEMYGYPSDTSAPEALEIRAEKWTKGLHSKPLNFRSIIPHMTFEGEEMTSLKLMPIELGFNRGRTFKGLPTDTDAKTIEEICAWTNEVSASYGTSFRVKDGLLELA
ncbi:MAG: CapA family protein [Ruminococcaceae bacterium]|nr:CapA family protein [Oscillospiraceae bacterium]